MKSIPVVLHKSILLIALALASVNIAWAFELVQLKQQKPYVLEIRYGSQEALATSTEPSAEFLAKAERLSLRVAATDSGQLSNGPFTFGFTLSPMQKEHAYRVTFQGEYQLNDAGKSFQGASKVQLNEWMLIAETSTTILTQKGQERQAFAVAMRLRKD